LLRLRTRRRGLLREQFFLEAFRAEGLPSTPATRIARDHALPVEERDGIVVGFDDDPFANERWRRAVTIAVELHAHILVHQSIQRVAIIGKQRRQWTKRAGLEAVCGFLSSFTMLALVGGFLQPLAQLMIGVGQ
jgi:hypothetical protein